VQRLGSSVNAHVHLHMLPLDGVYAARSGRASPVPRAAGAR
jgi:hypothetical protein